MSDNSDKPSNPVNKMANQARAMTSQASANAQRGMDTMRDMGRATGDHGGGTWPGWPSSPACSAI